MQEEGRDSLIELQEMGLVLGLNNEVVGRERSLKVLRNHLLLADHVVHVLQERLQIRAHLLCVEVIQRVCGQ